MSDKEGKQSDQNQLDSRERRHHQADRGSNAHSQVLDKCQEAVQGARSTTHDGVDDGNRCKYFRKSRSG